MIDERVIEVPIQSIKILDNSRLRIEETDLVPLMEDIKHRGLLQPIGLLQEGEFYIIRFGHRRFEACKKLGWQTITAILSNRELNEDSFMADNIAENLHRVDLSPIELADKCVYYQKKGYTVSEIAARLTLSKGQIANAIKLAESAPETFKKSIVYMKENSEKANKKGKISRTVAGEILFSTSYLTDKEKEMLLKEAKKNELSGGQVRLIKHLIKSGLKYDIAIKQYKEYKMCGCELPFKLDELKKYKHSQGDLFKAFILGDIQPNKKLLPQVLPSIVNNKLKFNKRKK